MATTTVFSAVPAVCAIPSQASCLSISDESCSLGFARPSTTQNSRHSTAGSYPSVFCGRGDKRTAKGKRFRQSFGNSRPKSNKGKSRSGLGPTPLPPRPPKKEEEYEYVHIDIDESLYD